jgi:hypothetical protein
MDPLTAVAFSGNLLQFVEVAVKVLKSTYEIFSKESLNSSEAMIHSVKQLEAISRYHIEECRNFETKFRLVYGAGAHSKSAGMRQADDFLEALCKECYEIAETLVSKLGNFQVPETTSGRAWKSLYVSILAMWSKDDINRQLQRLNEIRNSVQSTILASLR